MQQTRFRTRLFLSLALFAFVPSIVLTLGWSTVANWAVPQLSQTGAWEQVAMSGERAIRLSRAAPGTPEAAAALAVHEQQLGESRMQARRFRLLSERAVPAGAAERLDPRVLVRRDGLGRELAADPVGLLGEDDAPAQCRRRERRGHAAGAAADDQDRGVEFVGRG